jgi:hypothetical protein
MSTAILTVSGEDGSVCAVMVLEAQTQALSPSSEAVGQEARASVAGFSWGSPPGTLIQIQIL